MPQYIFVSWTNSDNGLHGAEICSQNEEKNIVFKTSRQEKSIHVHYSVYMNLYDV